MFNGKFTQGEAHNAIKCSLMAYVKMINMMLFYELNKLLLQ